MPEELRSCPFCGGEAELLGGAENWTPTFYDPDSGGDPYSVSCKTCGALMLGAFYEAEQVIAAWNTRT